MGKVYATDPIIPTAQVPDPFTGTVCGSVIEKQEFPIGEGLVPNTPDRARNGFRLVEHGQEHADGGWQSGLGWRMKYVHRLASPGLYSKTCQGWGAIRDYLDLDEASLFFLLFFGRDLPNVPRKIFPLLVLLSPFPIPGSFPSFFGLYERFRC